MKATTVTHITPNRRHERAADYDHDVYSSAKRIKQNEPVSAQYRSPSYQNKDSDEDEVPNKVSSSRKDRLAQYQEEISALYLKRVSQPSSDAFSPVRKKVTMQLAGRTIDTCNDTET